MAFSEELLDHFQNPRNAGELLDADAVVEVSNPVCGDVLRLAVKIADGHIREARFLCRGCTTAIACASWTTERILGAEPSGVRKISAEEVSAGLGGLPAATFHAAQMAVDALKALAAEILNK